MHDRKPTTWPQAAEMQAAARHLADQAARGLDEGYDPQIPAKTVAEIAQWMNATADALAWLAPYRDNEPGYHMWNAAEAVAREVLARQSSSHSAATYLPPAKYNRSDGALCCPHATPVAPGSCEFCWELHQAACAPCWEQHLADVRAAAEGAGA